VSIPYNTTSLGYSGGYALQMSWGYGVDPNAPRLVGGVVPEFSCCTDLMRLDDVPIWDANRYYRDLGIGWPYKPTRPEIRRAYRQGEANARRTFVVKQLLDRNVRPLYDRTPLGSEYVDVYVWAKIKERAMAAMRQRGVDTEDVAAAQDFMEKMGVKTEVDDDTPDSQDVLDNDSKPDNVQPEPLRLPPFPYAYYVWKTQPTSQDRDVLADWQRLLIRALSDLGVRMRVSLGLMGHNSPHEWSTGVVGRRQVAYFNRITTPSAEVAAKAAKAMLDSTT
jgi:hypothetical protein